MAGIGQIHRMDQDDVAIIIRGMNTVGMCQCLKRGTLRDLIEVIEQITFAALGFDLTTTSY